MGGTEEAKRPGGRVNSPKGLLHHDGKVRCVDMGSSGLVSGPVDAGKQSGPSAAARV